MAIVQLHPVKRRAYRGEEKWFPLLEKRGATALRSAFIEVGVSPQIAGNLVWFLEDQMTLERSLGESTRNRYRGLLAELDYDAVDKAANGLRSTRPIPGQFNSGHAA